MRAAGERLWRRVPAEVSKGDQGPPGRDRQADDPLRLPSRALAVKLRQRVTKGARSRNAGLAMVYRLLLRAEKQWRRLNGRELLPLVREGVRFKDGLRVEREVSQSTKKERTAPGTREKVAA